MQRAAYDVQTGSHRRPWQVGLTGPAAEWAAPAGVRSHDARGRARPRALPCAPAAQSPSLVVTRNSWHESLGLAETRSEDDVLWHQENRCGTKAGSATA